MSKQLKHPPLVEALLEIKWNLKQNGPDSFIDPGFKFANGRLYDRIKKRFGDIQQLPSTLIPEELTPHTVRTQFRVGNNAWPLVQFGPGIATVNFTSSYSWKSFKEAIEFFVPQLVDSYSGLGKGNTPFDLTPVSVLLRYINAQEFDWSINNVLDYISNNFHIAISSLESIPNSESIYGQPANLNYQIGHLVSKPEGQGLIRITTGLVGQSKRLIWELLFLSAGKHAPPLNLTNEFLDWLVDAHDVLEKWFFAMIDGALLKQYKGD